MMQFIIWIIAGAMAGWFASILMDTNKQMGLMANVLIGMIGSLLGGLIITLITTGDADLSKAFTGFNAVSIGVSILGAIFLLGMLSLFRGDRNRF